MSEQNGISSEPDDAEPGEGTDTQPYSDFMRDRMKTAGYIINEDGSVTSPWRGGAEATSEILRLHYLDRIIWVPELTEDDIGVGPDEDD